MENDLFKRPASYWLKRAERCKQSGDLIRAAVLERHAVRAEPENDAARMSYALTLRQLHCYEASNREAFAALAHNPAHTALFGLVGQNMFNLSLREAGMDAMNLYAANPPAVPPAWQDEAYDLADAHDFPRLHTRRRARLKGLLQIATQRMGTGDVQAAQRALERAQRPPFQAPNAERELLLAICSQHQGRNKACQRHLQQALALKPYSVKLMANAALLYGQCGCKADARRMLLRAALHARTPHEELLVCAASDELKQPQTACIMLQRSLLRKPDRFPVCYNLCVCMLRLGRLKEAERYIHLCREIDPDDIEGELLFRYIMTINPRVCSRKQIRDIFGGVGYYGVLSRFVLTTCSEPIWPVVHRGPKAMARAILQDDRLRRRFLYLLTLPLDWPPMMLAAMLPHLPADAMAALCREILLQRPEPSPAKQCATAILKQLGVQPPYHAWSDDHIVLIDPDRAEEPSPTFVQRILALRLRQTRRMAPGGVIPWALERVHRMNRDQRRSLMADHLHVWPMALAMVYRAQHGLPPLRIQAQRVGQLGFRTLRDALSTLHRLERKV